MTAEEPTFDVVGIGNALVDVLVHVDDAFLAAHAMDKGLMSLVDAEQLDELYALMPPAIEKSGGSAANTMAGIASLGARGAYIGRVGDDQLGGVFRHDIRAAGVVFESASAPGEPTGRCLTFVTSDAQRTMKTFLGAAANLTPGNIAPAMIRGADVLYLEGYLFDPPLAQEAFREAARLAHEAGRRVALTLSDASCVERHRVAFLDLMEHHVDVLFANESELLSLYETPAFDDALALVRGHCDISVLTRGANGSVVVAGGEIHTVEIERVGAVVDTTGAGDSYAAGFLVGLTAGRDPAFCGRMGALCAAEVISHFGARPETSLARLVEERLR